METRIIGSLKVSVVGLGCNNFGRRLDAQKTADVLNAAMDAGINFFDTADIYGSGLSETYMAPVIKPHRDKVVIASKFGMAMEGQGSGASVAYIQKAIEASLRRLDTDRIDLYQIHQPDPNTPIAETLGALNDLVKAGKVREIGCSNFSVAQLQEAASVVQPGAARFVSVQNEYSILKREPETDVLPECERAGLAFLPYFPLASGMLTGKYRKDQPEPENTRITTNPANKERWLSSTNLTVVEALAQFAEAQGHTLLELAFAWLLRWSSVSSVIAGASNAAQIQANVAAAGWKLTETEIAQINTIVSQHNPA